MSIRIRLANPEEHDAVDELVRAAYEHDYGPREHGDDPFRLSAHRSRVADVWVAVEERIRAIDPLVGSGVPLGDAGLIRSSKLLGTITIRRAGGRSLQEDTHDDELDFRLLGVDPKARGRGLGTLLTEHAIALARSRGLEGVFLKSAPDMLGAHRLYESLGFTRAPHRDGLVIGGEIVLDLYGFELPLGPSASSGTEVGSVTEKENEYV